MSIQFILREHGLLFATLLVKVAIVAMAASLLLRYHRFSRVLIVQPPSFRERTELGVILGIIAAMEVAIARLRLGYTGVDTALIMALLAGLVSGWSAGAWAGGIGAIVPTLAGEWLAFPVNMAAGISTRLARRLLSRPADIWLFSPMPFENTVHTVRRWRNERVVDARVLVLVVVAGTVIVAIETSRFFGSRWFFSLVPNDPVSYYGVIFASLTCVGVFAQDLEYAADRAHPPTGGTTSPRPV